MDTTIEYLMWISGRPADTRHNLGSSALSRKADRWPVPDRLADLPNPDRSLVGLLANEYGVDRSNVLVAPGATGANVFAATAALADGERVLVEQPGYEPLHATPASLGASIDRFNRPAPDYRLDPDRIADSIEPDTALVTITNRHNPSGRRVGRDKLATVASVVADHGATLLVDEVYAPFGTAPTEGRTAFGGPTAAGLPNTVVTGSLTKFHGLGGLRIGWVIGPETFVKRARIASSHVTGVAAPSRALARRALAGHDELAADSRELIAENTALLSRFVDSRDDLAGPVFDGCTYGALTHDRMDGDAVSRAAEAAGILVVPGRFFDAPGRFRISLGMSPDDCEAALDAFGAVLDGC